MTKFLIIFALFFSACEPTLDEHGLGSETDSFPEDLVKKYSQFKLAKIPIAFCIEGDFRFAHIKLGDYVAGNSIGDLISLTNDVYKEFHGEFEFTEIYIQTHFIEYRFRTIPVDLNTFKTDTVFGGPQDTLVNIR